MVNGIEGMVGDQGVVTVGIPGSIHLGSVRARGEEWPALSASGEQIPESSVVFILDVRDGHLVVAPSIL